ncbi:MAG: magnesium transporter [Ruminococcaceae bacterium]|nr:magnesium transporter [Oscillospiraceae bacterium]
MTERALDLLRAKRFQDLKGLFSALNPADVAQIFEELPNDNESLPILFRILPKEMAADVFIEMDNDNQELLIRAFNDKELKDVLDELFVDDTVDLIEEMPAGVVKRILRNTDPETRQIINQILKYPDDSAGSLMTTEYVRLQKEMTVDQAFARIRATGADKETIYTCYVTDERRLLLGVVTVRQLLLADRTEVLQDIMETNIISVDTFEDKEVVAQLMSKYDFSVVPVVDKEKRLVGIITFDDALDVMVAEATEDIAKMSAVTPTDKPYLKTGVLETWKTRIPWLLLLMISATFTGMIITRFESALAAYVILTAYIPMLMDTGGNSGSQASVTIIRSLSLGDVDFSDLPQIVFKEARVAVLCGGTLAVANFVKLLVLDKLSVAVAAVVCLTLMVTVLVAKIVGCTLPVLAKKAGFDPTVMASPFITTIVDAMSLIIYFSIATQILHL